MTKRRAKKLLMTSVMAAGLLSGHLVVAAIMLAGLCGSYATDPKQKKTDRRQANRSKTNIPLEELYHEMQRN